MILAHGICIRTPTLVKIDLAVAEIWALPVFAAGLGAAHLDQIHRQPDFTLPLHPRMLDASYQVSSKSVENCGFVLQTDSDTHTN